MPLHGGGKSTTLQERAFHEPQDASLANEQVVHLGFMVPMHAKKRKGALHEPGSAAVPAASYGGVSPPARTPGETPGELAGEDACDTSAAQFMVPMHGNKGEGAFREPPNWSSGFSRPPKGGTPYRGHDSDRFMVRNGARARFLVMVFALCLGVFQAVGVLARGTESSPAAAATNAPRSLQ